METPRVELGPPFAPAPPEAFSGAVILPEGERLHVRPIRPADEPRLARFHAGLSDRSVYQRYFRPIPLAQRVRHARLSRLCFADFRTEIPLIVLRGAGRPDEEILAVGRLHRDPGRPEAEFALVVADAWQRRGVGDQLLARLEEAARAAGCTRLTGTLLAENLPMQRLCHRRGFTLRPGSGGEVTAERTLVPAARPA
ncbi:MAG: GNAT family N-acetyltransferase [Opitutaceae bacterium]